MDRRLALAATVLVDTLGGCWGAPKPSTPPLMMPPTPLATGLVWQSPVQPWHLRHVTSSLAIAGDVAMIGSDDGWITRMDLRTGRITGEKQLDPALAIQGLAALPGQRWFVVGHGEKVQRLWTLDGATLDASVLELANDKRVGTTAFEVAVLADGGLVITGRGLPLAIYDARTFAVRTTLDPELGWSHPRAVGTSLYAEQRYRGHRFELATGARIQLPVRVEITPTTNLQELRKGSTAVVARLDGAVATPLPEEIDTFATGPTETFVTVRKTQLQIRTAPTGEIVRRVELGASARGAVASRPVVDATRAVFDAGAILRVVDLATGAITPEGAPPWGRATRVALDAAGGGRATGAGFAGPLAAPGPAGA
ncbi:MAG: hypothetical protein NT062_17540, partial [Proteobacteria bacterium]|nr:hypothetical protein [Pseudomonadota bacterium]